jgi:hypothetical protein
MNEDQQQVSGPPAAPATPGLPAPRDDPSRMPSGTTSNAAPNLAAHQLHVAMTWAGRGEGVVPASAKDKGALWPGFGAHATPEELAPFYDPEQIRDWWNGRFKRAHVGLLTRRLVVIDLDLPKNGAEILGGRWAGCQGGTDVLELLMRQAGAEWPETYCVMTPSGGMHLYFLQPEDGPPIGCATGDGTTAPHLGPLVDVRGVGGYVIAAGSHSAAQGRAYTRVSPAALRPQPVPEWLLALLRRPAPERPAAPVRRLVTPAADSNRAERYAAAALQQLADRVAAAPDNERWKTLSGAALRLAELQETAPNVLTEQVVTDTLLAASRMSDPRKAERAIRTAWKSRTGAGAA